DVYKRQGIINLEQYDNLNGKDKQKQANEFLGTILTNAELIKPFLETTDKNPVSYTHLTLPTKLAV
ncbi:hypothetical protein KQJ29_36900, partial [Enterococcus sp. S181_ASV_20]|nr:hypothetical protein [Enterococcus sp. S181_ASV_20]